VESTNLLIESFIQTSFRKEAITRTIATIVNLESSYIQISSNPVNCKVNWCWPTVLVTIVIAINFLQIGYQANLSTNYFFVNFEIIDSIKESINFEEAN